MREEKKDSNSVSLGWFLKNPLELTLCLLLIAIVSLTVAQVLSRYVFGTSLAWSEELARFIFIWLAFLAAAYAFKMRSHFAIRFLVDKLSKPKQKVASVLVMLIASTFLIVFTWKAVEYTVRMSGQIAPGTGLSMAVPYSSAIVGGALMLYYVIKNWLEDVRSPHQEEEN